MTQADAERREARSEGADRFEREARVLRAAGAGADQELVGGEALDRGQGGLAGALDFDRFAKREQCLDEVEGEGVAVVEDEDHDGCIVAWVIDATGGGLASASGIWREGCGG